MGVNEKKIVRVDKAYVCSQAGENASSQIPATKTFIHNEKTYYVIQFTQIMLPQKMDTSLIAKD